MNIVTAITTLLFSSGDIVSITIFTQTFPLLMYCVQEKGPLQEKTCVRILQPLDDALHDHVDKMCQLGSFMAASSTNNKSKYPKLTNEILFGSHLKNSLVRNWFSNLTTKQSKWSVSPLKNQERSCYALPNFKMRFDVILRTNHACCIWNGGKTCMGYGYSQWITQSTVSDITSKLNIGRSVQV